MIPNSEDRSIKAEFEYNRRKYIQLMHGNIKAWLLLIASICLSIFCIYLNRKYKIFTFTLVAIFIGSWILQLYSLQVLITIWKEINTNDKYLPYVESYTSPLSFNSLMFKINKVNDTGASSGSVDSENGGSSSGDQRFSWNLDSIKSYVNYLLTPALKMTYTPSTYKSVTSEGEAGTFDVRNRVYADSSTISTLVNTETTKTPEYMGDNLLQELEYKTSYTISKAKEKVADTPYVDISKCDDLISSLCIELQLPRWCDNMRHFFYSTIHSDFINPLDSNLKVFRNLIDLKDEYIFHNDVNVSCNYNGTNYTGKDMSELLEKLRSAALTIKNSTNFGQIQSPQNPDEKKVNAEKLLQAIDSQMKIEALLNMTGERTKKYVIARLLDLSKSPFLLGFKWNNQSNHDSAKLSDSKILMSFFLWYMDNALAKMSNNTNPINEFSFYYFIGNQSSKYTRPTSYPHIREEIASQTHYNVYWENERWNIAPGENNVFQCLVIFLYGIKSFKRNNLHFHKMPSKVQAILS